MSNKRTNGWFWYSLRKRHILKHESQPDDYMRDLLLEAFRKIVNYLRLSFVDLARSIRIASNKLWLVLSATVILVALLHINLSKTYSINFNAITTSLTYQIVAGFALFLFIYKIKVILDFLWLVVGPNLRWLRLFLAFELLSILLSAYSFVHRAPEPAVNDIIIATATCAIVVALVGSIRQWIFVRRQKSLSQRSKLIADRVSSENFVINGQLGPAQRLRSIIENERDAEAPITILVDGKWGDGKTYMVNRIIESIISSSRDYIVVRFEPWRYVSEESIVTSFYSSLGTELANLPGSIGAQFDIAALSRNFVSKIDKTGTLESLLTQLPHRPVPSTGLKKAEKLLTDTGKRLVFILDDVERCDDKSRILRTLQLGLHLGSDIKNSTTIIIGDVQEIIKVTDINQSFLQKVIDEQVVVLPPTKKEMLNVTNSLMKALPFEINITQDQRLDFLTRNIRGVKRVLSGLSKDYEGVGDNIHPQDLFAMNVIRHAFPTVYADIMQNGRYYVPFEYEDYADEAFLLYGLSGEREESNFIKDQAEHLETLIKDLGVSDRSRRRLLSVLEGLFPATKNRFDGGHQVNNNPYSRQYRRERRIGASQDYLDRYFLLSTNVDKRHIVEDSHTKIRDEYFSESDDDKRLKLLGSAASVDDKESEELYYGSLADTLADLHHNDPNRKVLARDMLRLYFQSTDRVVRDNRRTLYIIAGVIDTYVENKDFAYVFEDLAEYMHHPSVGLRLLLIMNPTRQNNFFELKRFEGYNKLREKILCKTDEFYFDKKNNIIEEDDTGDREWRFTLAQWSTSVSYDTPADFIASRFNKVNDYLMNITDSRPEKFHNLLMHAFWHENVDTQEPAFNFKITPQPYDVEKFAIKARKLLKQKISNDLSNDFRKFLTALSEYKKSS